MLNTSKESTSIKEAFKLGTGDVCLRNGNKYRFISRKNPELLNVLIQRGMVFVSYTEVLEIDKAQNPVVVTIKPATTPVPAPKKTINYSTYSGPFNSYYDEFPDALNQSL